MRGTTIEVRARAQFPRVAPSLVLEGSERGTVSTDRVQKGTVPCVRLALGGIGAVAIAASLGGCSGVPLLPASNSSLGPNSPATRMAQSILYRLNHGDSGATVPPQPCSSTTAGRIGPLSAPYRICPVSTPVGHFVNFTVIGTSPEYGISYTDRGPETFLEQCYRHLVGQWWEFRSADLSNPQTPCPGGWRFHGGP